MHQHRLLSVSALALLGLSAAARAQGNPPLGSARVAAGLAGPVLVTAPPNDTSRLFIVEKNVSASGRIRLLTLPGHVLQPAPYLSVGPVATGFDEGLLGLAFHPDFASNGYFFVYFTNRLGDNQVVRYQATAPFATSISADASSATPVIYFAHAAGSIHNGGWLGFGPDDLLYVSTGDGGGSYDPFGNAQSLDALLGKILRIDVDGDDFPADAARNYRNPPGNPYAGATSGLDEIWHVGLRNPWRCGFDRLTGDLWIGDVGQEAWEEVNVQPAGVGGLNFGWRCMEGLGCTGLTGCACDDAALTPPVHAYSLAGTPCAVLGGYVYRGSAICGLQGEYFFADYCSNSISSFRYQGAPNPAVTPRTSELAPGGGLAIGSITSFGEDANGELYVCDGQGGEVFQIVPGAIADCDGNGQHDPCEIAASPALDANLNGQLDACEFSAAAYCFGDGTGTVCPCGNAGAALHGCASSVFAGGAKLDFTGQAIVGNDTLTLVASDLPNGAALFYQGSLQQNGGAGTVFGDGLRCAGGTVMRFVPRLVSGHQATYPDLGSTISAAGDVASAPQTRFYQCWYRDAAPLYCTAGTFNLTNGLRVVWGL